jgi:RecB family endonuclease NucS
MKKGSSFIRYGEAGISDIIGFTRVGTFFAVEVKRVKKKPTEGQKEFLALLKSTTLGQGLVAEDLADVVHWMNETIIPLVKSLNRA